jgi:hypothetical protein
MNQPNVKSLMPLLLIGAMGMYGSPRWEFDEMARSGRSSGKFRKTKRDVRPHSPEKRATNKRRRQH